MNADQKDDWRDLYQAALLELDPAKLAERIEQAYNAIVTRMESAHPNSHGLEQQPLLDAMATLRVLRRELVSVNREKPDVPAPTG